MQRGLPEPARGVEADPSAVFDAHGAESVDELVASGESTERDGASDRAVVRLFEGGLDRPERRSTAEEPSGEAPPTAAPTNSEGATGEPASEAPATGAGAGCLGESTTTPAILVELERAIDETEAAGPEAVDGEDLDALDDEAVADALAVAEELDGTGQDGKLAEADLPSSVPEEWRDD